MSAGQLVGKQCAHVKVEQPSLFTKNAADISNFKARVQHAYDAFNAAYTRASDADLDTAAVYNDLVAKYNAITALQAEKPPDFTFLDTACCPSTANSNVILNDTSVFRASSAANTCTQPVAVQGTRYVKYPGRRRQKTPAPDPVTMYSGSGLTCQTMCDNTAGCVGFNVYSGESKCEIFLKNQEEPGVYPEYVADSAADHYMVPSELEGYVAPPVDPTPVDPTPVDPTPVDPVTPTTNVSTFQKMKDWVTNPDNLPVVIGVSTTVALLLLALFVYLVKTRMRGESPAGALPTGPGSPAAPGSPTGTGFGSKRPRAAGSLTRKH